MGTNRCLSGEKQGTVSAIKPLLQHVYTEIVAEKERDSEMTQEMKSAIKSDLESRYSDPTTMDLLTLAHFWI